VSALEDWTALVAAELDLPAEVVARDVRDLLLDLTRDVAHGVARPAAPLTAFLVGLAAGRDGGGAEQVRATTEQVLRRVPAPPEG
jgi:hypothetical protein